MTSSSILASAASLALLIAMGGALVAQSPPQTTAPSAVREIDQRLLDGLESPSQAAPPAARSGDTSKPLGPGQSPLITIAEKMRAVEQRLARHDLSPPTLEAQRQIANDLAALLEQARQQQASGSKQSGGGQSSQQARAGTGNPAPGPPRESTGRIGHGESEPVETASRKDLLSRIWGHLPDKLRDQMQASLNEQFLPKYEQLIEDYYRRLAEDRSVSP